MTDYMLFEANHAITLRWMAGSRRRKVRRGELQDITQRELVVRLPEKLTSEDALHVGDKVRAEAAGYGGFNLTVFQGSVLAIESRLIRIRVGGEVDIVQRRRSLRARVPYQFASAMLLSNEAERRFVVQPIDLSRGGIRIRHRLALQAGDRFRVSLRLDDQNTVTPVGQIVESWKVEQAPETPNALPLYVSRAIFIDLPMAEQQQISRYVFRLLRTQR